jgi:hypothetical protein
LESSLARLKSPFGKYLRAHHISRAGLIAACLGAAVLFFFVGAGIRLLIGPVSLGPFSATLSDALAQALPGATVKYDQAAIEWSRDEGRVNLVILGARVFDADNRIIAQAPKADIDLAARPFLSGKVEVKRITLVGVQLTLVRTRDGGVRLGVGKNGRDFLTNITDAITATSSKTSSLQTFAVRDARIAIYDEVTGLFVVAPRANVTIETAGPNIASSLDADIEISGRPARVHASLLLPPKKGPVHGDVEFTGLDIGALGANARAFSLVKGIALNADMSASFTIDHGAHLASADFGVDAYGTVGVPGIIVGPVRVKSARIVGRYDGASGRLLVDDALLTSDRATAHLIGGVTFVYDASHALSSVAFETTADSMKLDMPGTLQNSVSFNRMALRGNYFVSSNDVVVDHFGLTGGSFAAQATGKITIVQGHSPAIEFKAGVDPLTAKELLHYWPLTIGAGARQWISDNIFAGKIGPLRFEAHIPAGLLDQPQLPDGALSLTFPVTGVEADYLHGLTRLTSVVGSGTLTGDTFTAEIPSARIGPLAVSRGRVVIANLHLPDTAADISAHVEGAVSDVLALIDHKPLGYPSRFGIVASDTKGSAGIDLSVLVPTKKDVSFDAVKLVVKAATRDFDIALGSRGRLSKGAIVFDVDNSHLSANGTALIATSQVSLNWQEDFSASSDVTTRIVAKGRLDDEARDALLLHTGAYLKGPVGVDATLTGKHGHFVRADITMDLTPARLALDLIGIDKPTGTPADAHLVADFAASGGLHSEDIRVSTAGGTILATQTFAADGSLLSLAIPTVRFGSANDFSFNLTKTAGGGTDVSIRGRSLDGSKIAHEGSNSAAGDPTKFDGPFRITAKLDRLALRDSVSIAPFSLEVAGDGDQLASLSLSGSLSHGATVTGSLSAGPSGRRVVVATDDAGELARGALGLTGMRGGKLEFAANLPPRPADRDPREVADFQGTVTLRDAKLTNQPFLARLFDMASFAGIQSLLQGQGIAIDKVEVPFSSKNRVISVHDAIATGPTLGATADGYIDRPQNVVALKGSLIPVVGIDFNKVLGAIPLVGDILVSKKGEGIFGVTYSVKGNADQPSMTVNPLSMLTPGILRRIFQGRIPNASQAPSNAPRPPPPPAQAATQTAPKIP